MDANVLINTSRLNYASRSSKTDMRALVVHPSLLFYYYVCVHVRQHTFIIIVYIIYKSSFQLTVVFTISQFGKLANSPLNKFVGHFF